MKKIIKIFILLFAIGCLPYAAMAQFTLPTNQLPNLNLAPTLSLSLDPQTPTPNSYATITANVSGITGANNTTFTWFLNGIKQATASGLNKNTFTFLTGAAGSVYKISAAVVTPNGDNLSDSIFFTASDCDLTWNAATEAPAGYGGKLLPIKNSSIMVSALPFIYVPGTKNTLAPSNLIYNWKLDNSLDTINSGAGKSTYNFTVTNYSGDFHTIRLEIQNQDGTISLIKNISIPVVSPQTLVYFADSKTNLPQSIALKNLVALSLNFNFVAQNYFFNAANQQLKWQWLVNNNEITGETDNPWLATLNVPSDTARPFSAQIQTVISNPAYQFESSKSTINLEIR